MSKYAAGTRVPVSQSRNEIESILQRYGADGFSYASTSTMAQIQFLWKGRVFQIGMELDGDDARETRRQWRVMILWLKGTLERVDAGQATMDQAFIGHLLLPNGRTVQEFVLPQIEHARESGNMPTGLPALEAPR